MHETMISDVVIAKLIAANDSIIESRESTPALSVFGSGKSCPVERLPKDLSWFRDHYAIVNLYSEVSPYPRNGWRLGHLSSWPDLTVNESRGGDPQEYPYFEDVWEIAHYAMDGGIIVAVDLHEGANFGRIGVVSQTDMDYGGGAVVVSLSFSEWLERTLDLGANAGAPYWRQKGFKDYGPLIPADPYYRPVEPLHEV